MKPNSNWRIAIVAVSVLALDQFTKLIVLKFLEYGEEKPILDGFFRLVHWGNTGAAWSMFRGNNYVLAAVAVLALFVLYLTRHQFDAHRFGGQVSLGLI